MEIITTLVSIFALTGLAYLVRRFTPLKVCPICAGVSLTWAWLFVGMLTGLLPTSNFQPLTSILMGGSIVGIAYQLEKRLGANRSPLLWKTLFIPIGFAAVWGVLNYLWWLALVAMAVCGILAAAFLRQGMNRTNPTNQTYQTDQTDKTDTKKKVAELEKKMEECC